MNVLQKTGRKQEALPFRVNERNGDISPMMWRNSFSSIEMRVALSSDTAVRLDARCVPRNRVEEI
jgi:hypothetical protein